MTISVSDDIGLKAMRLLNAGLRCEAEVLATGEVSLTIHDPNIEEDIAIEIVSNGPDVPEAVARLIEAASAGIAESPETSKSMEEGEREP
jgi:hypothetical protein